MSSRSWVHVGVGERDVQPLVDHPEVFHGGAHQHLPQPERLGVTGLQRGHPPPGPAAEPLVAVEPFPRRLVERGEVTRRQFGVGSRLAHLQRVLDQHAERGAPVTQVRRPDHGLAEEFQDARDGVAHRGGPQVADMQFLGHVRAGVVDDHPQARIRRGRAEALVGEQAGRLAGDPAGGQRQVHEAGPADIELVAHAGYVEVCHDPLGHLARRHAEALGERQRHVRLEVRELRGTDERIGARMFGTEGGGDRRAHPFRENLLGIGHAYQPIGGRGPGRSPAPLNGAAQERRRK